MPEPRAWNENQAELAPWTRSLIGLLDSDGANPPLTDEQVQEQYYHHLAEKHRTVRPET
jgi:hypothetical protein